MSLTGLLGRKKPPSKTACCLVAGAGHIHTHTHGSDPFVRFQEGSYTQTSYYLPHCQ